MLLVWSIVSLVIITRGMLSVPSLPMAMMAVPDIDIDIAAADLAAIAGPVICR